MRSITVLAPAKLNLGLEIIGRRADGYHNIATVMQTVSVFDRMTMTPAGTLSLHVSTPELVNEDNLALKAARELKREFQIERGASIALTKRIPAAAGLGGASSDAAATLVGLSRLWRLMPDAIQLLAIATRLGSDVPFLLNGGTALASERGDMLTTLRPLTGIWFVLVVPAIAIPRKTATLYAALASTDFTSGNRARQLASDIDAGCPLKPELLGNAFQRPLHALQPDLSDVEHQMRLAGAPFVALSGAGPAHYTSVADLQIAHSIAFKLRRTVERETRILVCRPVSQAPVTHASNN